MRRTRRSAIVLAVLALSAAPLAAGADYYCKIGSSLIGAPGDGSGSGCVLWDGASAPPSPPAQPAASGGGGGVAISPAGGGGGRAKDVCPSGDMSPSYYDRRCDADPGADAFIDSVSARLNLALASRPVPSRGRVVLAFAGFAAGGKEVRAFPGDSRRIFESVAQIVAAGTGTASDVPGDSEFCGKDASYADLTSRGIGRKLGVLVSCGALGQGAVVSEGRQAYRAEAVAAFASAFALKADSGASAFADVPASLAPVYLPAAKAGLVMPGRDGLYGPEEVLTKADLRRMMLSVGAYSSAASAPDSEDSAEYADLVAALYSARKEAAK